MNTQHLTIGRLPQRDHLRQSSHDHCITIYLNVPPFPGTSHHHISLGVAQHSSIVIRTTRTQDASQTYDREPLPFRCVPLKIERSRTSTTAFFAAGENNPKSLTMLSLQNALPVQTALFARTTGPISITFLDDSLSTC
jgi:hypothetical protein